MEKQLKIKDEFEGLIVTKNIFNVGTVTFDFSKAQPKHFAKYKAMGFDIFEEVEQETFTAEFNEQTIKALEDTFIEQSATVTEEQMDYVKTSITLYKGLDEKPKKNKKTPKDKIKQEPDQE